jgi:hypothetical protein
MSEADLLSTGLLDDCGTPGCLVCQLPGITVEMLVEGEH